MKRSMFMFAMIITVLAAGAALAECGMTHQKGTVTCVPTTPQSTGQMMQCPPMTQQQAITVDNNYVYILQGNEVVKLRKSDLAFVARTPISGPDARLLGRGPIIQEGTPVYPSGSDIDIYAPTGDVTTSPVDRAYDYQYDYDE